MKRTQQKCKPAPYRAPEVAGQVVPTNLIKQWYRKLEKSGFDDIELFDANMEPVTNNLKRTSAENNMHLFMQRMELGTDEEYWRACDLFLFYWSGWNTDNRNKRRIWELYTSQEHSLKEIKNIMIKEYNCKLHISKCLSVLREKMREWLKNNSNEDVITDPGYNFIKEGTKDDK